MHVAPAWAAPAGWAPAQLWRGVQLLAGQPAADLLTAVLHCRYPQAGLQWGVLNTTHLLTAAVYHSRALKVAPGLTLLLIPSELLLLAAGPRLLVQRMQHHP